MLIDTAVVILIGLALFKGFSKGFIVAVFTLVAYIIGLAAALKLSALAARSIGEYTSISQRWLPVLAFMLVFIMVVLLVRIGARILEKGAQLMMLGWLNRIGGVLFYLLIYLFVLSIFLFYMVQLEILKPSVTETSAAYPYIQPVAQQVLKILSTIFPFLKHTFSELLLFFDAVAE